MIALAATALAAAARADLAPPPSDYALGGLAIVIALALIGALGFLGWWLIKRRRKR
ncbi:MAG TPA: hypothetical protein VFF06_19120 [Polyangia bacterium]|nr:hypothetical protein [Polyangia bacterium]